MTEEARAYIIEDRTFMARAAEQAGRFGEMISFLKELIEAKTEDFNVEERNLLSAGFKKSVEAERRAIRFVNDIS